MTALGGRNLGTARGAIEIDTSDLNQVQAAARQVGQNVNRSLGAINTGAQRAQSGMAGMQQSAVGLRSSLMQLGPAIGLTFGVAGIAQLGRIAIGLTETAAQAERTRVAFENLAEGSGQSADQMLAAMQRASGGMISNADLVLAANRAMLLGVADSGEELAQLLEVARVRGAAMGLSVTKAFDDLVTGLGRMSPLILDNLGILTGGEAVFSNYAASVGRTADSLTDAEKKQILFNKVIVETAPLLEANANNADTNADKLERAAAAAANFRQALGTLIGPSVTQGLQNLSEALSNVTGAIERMQQARGGASFGAMEAASFGIPIRPPLPSGGVGPRFPTTAQPTGITGGAAAVSQLTTEQTAAISKWGQAITDAEERIGEQRANIVTQYGMTIARDAEDFARDRARQEVELNRQISDIRQDGAQREVEWRQDLEERIAGVREDGNDRIQDLERDHQRNRERNERDHRDRLFSAAANLDARAVRDENRRFANQQSDQEEQFRDRVDAERDNLQERIDQENEAHRERLQDARDADDERVRDLRDAQDRQRQIEDEDRQLRLERMAEDHARQLAQMDSQAAQERATRQDAFLQQLADLGIYTETWKQRQKELLETATEAYEDFLQSLIEKTTALQRGIGGGQAGILNQANPSTMQMFADGGFVGRTGLAMVHAGEYVTSARNMAMQGAGTPGGGNLSLSLGPGSIVVNEASRPGQTGQEIEQALLNIIRRAA